ncbi:MAG: diaminopimelate epimerase [Tannerella sp.]|jgi:diaminopimelate epimerase|nr:diaminopimelate epimerase [Tannerella sp.]
MKVSIEKYHGLGNDYIVFDPLKNSLELNEERIKLICDRNFGCGSDGILFGPLMEDGKIKVKIYNPDGSEAEKSGNGVRIFSKYLKDFGYILTDSFVLSTLGGDVDVQYLTPDGKLLKVRMGKVTFRSSLIPVIGVEREVVDEPMTFGNQNYRVTCLSIGNPHCVIPMDKISKEKAIALGQIVESSLNFPNRINMQLLKVIDRRNIRIEIYERGAGYTLASGSSSCAAAGAAYKLGLVDNKITVHMPGGELEIEINPDGAVYMTGTVNRISTMTFADEFIEELILK